MKSFILSITIAAFGLGIHQRSNAQENIRVTYALQEYKTCLEQQKYAQAYMHIKYIERYSKNADEVLFHKIRCLLKMANFKNKEDVFVKEIKECIRRLQELQENNFNFNEEVDMEWLAKMQMNYLMEGPIYDRWLADEEYQRGVYYQNKKSYEKALINFNYATSKNNGLAYWELAKMYEEGQGVPKDQEQAIAYYEIAAENHIGIAHYAVAKNMLYDAEETLSITDLSDDEQTAYLNHLKEASLLNVAQAEYQLGQYYHEMAPKTNKKEYYAKAFYHFNNAAANGDTDAMIQLAQMHCKGSGTIQSYKEAKYWIEELAKTQKVSHSIIVQLQDCIKDL